MKKVAVIVILLVGVIGLSIMFFQYEEPTLATTDVSVEAIVERMTKKEPGMFEAMKSKVGKSVINLKKHVPEIDLKMPEMPDMHIKEKTSAATTAVKETTSSMMTRISSWKAGLFADDEKVAVE